MWGGAGIDVGVDCSVGFWGRGVPHSVLPVLWRDGGVLLPPQRRMSTLKHLANEVMQGQSLLAQWKVLGQERECEHLAVHSQRSNGGAIYIGQGEGCSARHVAEQQAHWERLLAGYWESLLGCLLGKPVGWLLAELNGMLLLQQRHGSIGQKQRWCGVNIAH